jgi:hypothetical protein
MPKGVEFEQQCSYDASCLQGVTWQWDEIVGPTVATLFFTEIYRTSYP